MEDCLLRGRRPDGTSCSRSAVVHIRKKHAKNSYHIWYEIVYKRYEIILISMCGMMTYHFFSFHTIPNVVHTRCILFHTT